MKQKYQKLDIVLQGGSYGIESTFMQKVIKTCKQKGNSVITFNFPYFERGDNHSSGPELKEELATLTKQMNKYNANKYQHIRFVAKSLGAIVASYFLRNLNAREQEKYSVVVLGYVTGSIDLHSFKGKIDVIQGELDKFGDINVVKKDLKNSVSKKITYHEIKNADHSYRNPKTKKPTYEDQAIQILKFIE